MQLNHSCPEKKQTQVAIVGGAMVGMSLGLLLARAGIKTTIIEASDTLPGGRKLALSSHTIDGLSDLGVWQIIAEQAASIKKVVVAVAGHRPKVHLRSQGEGCLGQVIKIEPLNTALKSTVLQTNNLIYHCPVKVEQIEKLPFGYQLGLSDGSCLETALLVGADGTHSFVRKKLGISALVEPYEQQAIVCQGRFEKPIGHTAWEYFDKDGTLAILPMGSHEAAIIWTLPAVLCETYAALSDSHYVDHVLSVFGKRLGSLTLTTKRQHFPMHYVRASNAIAHHSVLVGNAAHTLHPIAAQGFNLSFSDILALSDQLINAYQQGEPLGEAKQLSRYVMSRLTAQRAIERATDLLARQVSGEKFSPSLKALGLLALELSPLLKQKIVQIGTGRAS